MTESMTRRIIIARDGTVKLRGKATRWEVGCVARTLWGIWRPDAVRAWGGESKSAARAYLESLTDEELMG